MRKLIIIIFLLLFLTGCSPLTAETIPITPETVTVVETKIEYIEVENTDKIQQLETELAQYQSLIANLNDLLKNVYYVYGEGNGTFVYGTGFSIEYKDKFYLITAGHIVDGEWGIHKNLGFKVNFSDNWIYPKLLAYKVTDTIPDYAIFYSDKITTGLSYDLENTEPVYRLGTKVLIEENNNWGEAGECGEPVIDLDGEVIGLHVGYLQDIDEVLQAIDTMQ